MILLLSRWGPLLSRRTNVHPSLTTEKLPHFFFVKQSTMMATTLPALLLLCLIAGIDTKGSAHDAADNDIVVAIVDQIIGDEQQRSSFNGVVAALPQCWRSAVAMIQKAELEIHADSAAALCASLPEAHQKRLALEIADCHMQDRGLPLYQNSIVAQRCTTATVDSATVQMCLKHLTDAGASAYMQYITHVQILCTRQTQELFLRHQLEVKDDISRQYAKISGQSIEQMRALAEFPSIIKEQVTNELKEALQHTLNEQLKDRLNFILQSQATEQAAFVASIMDQQQQRDDEHKVRSDDFQSYQTSVMLQQSREMERQRKVLEEHRAKMQSLTETVSETTLHMQPLFGLQSLVKVATEGYTWITFLLHFLGTFNIVWVITRPQRCHPFRSYLYCLVLTEALLELALTGAVQYGVLSESDRIVCVAELRRWAIFVECGSYVFGMILTCFNSDPVKVGADGSALTRNSRQDLERMLDERLGLVQKMENCAVDANSSHSHGGVARVTPWQEPERCAPAATRLASHTRRGANVNAKESIHDASFAAAATPHRNAAAWQSQRRGERDANYIESPYGYPKYHQNQTPQRSYYPYHQPDPSWRPLDAATTDRHGPAATNHPGPQSSRASVPSQYQEQPAYWNRPDDFHDSFQQQQPATISIDPPPPPGRASPLAFARGVREAVHQPTEPPLCGATNAEYSPGVSLLHGELPTKRFAVTHPMDEPDPKRVAVSAGP